MKAKVGLLVIDSRGISLENSRTLFEKITEKSQTDHKNLRKITTITEKWKKNHKKSHKNHQNNKKMTVIFEITKISYTFL